MQNMTGIERMGNILRRKPVDRIGLCEHFWGDTQKKWSEDGYIRVDEDLADHFNFDVTEAVPFNLVVDLDFVPTVIDETEETVLTRDGNGALLRRHKLHDTTPEHVDFMVKERKDWEKHIKPKLKAERRRINFEAYRYAKKRAAEKSKFFTWSGANVFELLHPVCGHEYMLMGMALDPDWIVEMVDTYSRITVGMQEMLFSEEGYLDGIWFYEDMGFKGHPFISPAMYSEIIQPAHKRTFGFAHSKGLPVIVHSCGMVEALVPGLMEAGMDCLQVIDVKASMDLLKLYRDFGDVLSFMGGIDVRVLYTNDRKIIYKELEAKIPVVMGKCGFVLHSDHSIPSGVNYDVYRYFIDKGLELGTYK